MQVVLQNCRGRVDSVVAPYIQLALRRYGTARKKLMQARVRRRARTFVWQLTVSEPPLWKHATQLLSQGSAAGALTLAG